MKKVFGIIISLFIIFPIAVQADDSITNYRIDITVLENGDVDVLEAFEMSGRYNGFERIINYKSNFNSYYGNRLSSTGDATIYNGNGIALNEIRGIDFDVTKTLLELQANGDLFAKVGSASKGDYGVYTLQKRNEGETYLIYNQSKMNKDFFLSYTLKNMVVVHEDIAELGYNVFTELSEAIDHLEIYIHLPNNQELLRVWAHGPLHGLSEIIDDQTVKLTIDDLNAEEAIDFRLAFDKEVVPASTKTTEQEVLENIIVIEEKLAEQANDERHKAYLLLQEDAYTKVEEAERTKNRKDYETAYEKVLLLREEDELKTQLMVRLMNLESKVERKETILKVTFTSISVAWTLGLLVMIYYVYQKFDKEYEPQFKGKYFREFPASYGPTSVGYLFHRKISNDDLSASILDLINRKVIGYEEKDKDYIFKVLPHKENLVESEQRLLKFLFDGSETIELSNLKKRAKKDYNHFITLYSNWLNRATLDAELERFYEDLTNCKVVGILYSIIGIVLGIYLVSQPTYFTSLIMTFTGIIALIYFIVFTKKTVKGSEDYSKWIGLKRFMEDFGKMDDKELPEIHLWEKYLVYAVSLGCADKLAKQMRIKAEALQVNNPEIQDTMFDMIYFNHLLNFNRTIHHAVQQSISTAYNTKAATSAASSGGGFGGGFSGGSFGGGSFGGGGGGGRF